MSAKLLLEQLKKGELSPAEGVKQFKQLKQAKQRQTEKQNSAELLFVHADWVDAPLQPVSKPTGDILVFDTTGDLIAELQRVWQQREGSGLAHTEVRWARVSPGARYAVDGDHYQLPVADAKSYTRLLDDLKAQGFRVGLIIHAWSNDTYSPEVLTEQLDSSIGSLFLLSQALLQQKLQQKQSETVEVQYVYRGQVGSVSPVYAALSGFARTVQLEAPHYHYKTIELAGTLVESSEKLLDEWGQRDEVQIRYSVEGQAEKGRAIRKLVEQTLPPTDSVAASWREGGVYLITGGLGGIGRLLASYLLRRYNARLILTGRSELDESRRALLEPLQALGGEVLYLQADVGERPDVQRLIASIKKRYGVLHGVVHAAGLIRDSFLLKKTEEELQAVLKPKVWGTVWLDEATRNEALELFVLFSSGAAVMGNVGQADYAYASGFQDHYAHWRVAQGRPGRSLSINWPLWEEGGMEITAEARAYMQDVLGVLPLRTSSALRALDDGLRLETAQFMALEGDRNKILTTLRGKKPLSTDSERSADAEAVPDPVFRPRVEAFLKEILSQEIKLPVGRIEAHEPFENYGIDSVRIIGLSRRLEQHFGELSKTLFFEYYNVQELTDYFLEQHRDRLRTLLKEEKPVMKPSSSSSIVDLVVEKSQPEKRRHKSVTKKGRRLKTTSQVSRPESTPEKEDDIAIIGMSGRYPKAGDLETFWENLYAGRDCIEEIPSQRWDYQQYYTEGGGSSRSKWGGFINDVDMFDPLFFNISPKDADAIDPQERLFLETVWHTVEDAGYTRTALRGDKVGVYVGVMYSHYQLFGAEELVKGRIAAAGSSYSSIANRASYFFNFHGPSIAVDTMCSSSLTALHLACESIRSGECQYAVAGGVNLSIHPYKYVLLSRGDFVSSDGRCRTFGEGGDGYVPGEGVGAVLLKPLSQAVADGDSIYGVIRATAVNHGGKTNGYTVPNPNAQAEVVAEALQRSGIEADSISYVEAHGTGTALGDPIEITGLNKAFGDQQKQSCAIGSVKSNIGHLESAAGIAGLTKVLLQMKHRTLVPSLHAEQENPNIRFQDSPFRVQREVTEWKRPVAGKTGVYPRRAGISSFGAGGSNAHIIVEEYEGPKREIAAGEQLLVLSARNEDRLKAYAEKLVGYLRRLADSKVADSQSVPQLAEIAYTLQVGREAMDERLALVVNDLQSLQQKLEEFCSGNVDDSSIHRGNAKTAKATVHLLTDSAAGDEFIAALLRERDWNSVAKMWTTGIDVNWSHFYLAGKPSRISLPVYPFARERCWVDISPNTQPKNLEGQQAQWLHPLIGRNMTTVNGLKYQTTLSRQAKQPKQESLAVSADADTPVLLTGACIEMARAAGELAGEQLFYSMQNMVWGAPLRFNAEEETVEISLFPDETGFDYEITVKDNAKDKDDAECVLHQGYLKTAALTFDEDSVEDTVIDLASIQARSKAHQQRASVYQQLKKEYGIVVEFGQQLIEESWIGSDEAVAALVLSEAQREDDCVLQPTMLEAVLHTVALCASVKVLPGQTLQVMSIKALTWSAAIPGRVYVCVQAAVGDQAFDAWLVDESGRVFMHMQEVVWQASNEVVDNTVSNEIVAYECEWQEAPIQSVPVPAGDIIVFDTTGDLIAELQRVWQQRERSGLAHTSALPHTLLHTEVRWARVSPGARYAVDGDHYQLPVADAKSYARLLDDLKAQGFRAGLIIHAWSDDTYSSEVLTEQLDSSIGSLFLLSQALLQQRPQQKQSEVVEVQYVYRGQEGSVSPVYAALSGFARTVQLEAPHYHYKTIELAGALVESSEKLLDEWGQRDEVQIRYSAEGQVEKGRAIRKLVEQTLPPPDSVAASWREGGVYLITGGLGGIGRLLASHLLRHHNARLVLTGRSELDESRRAQLEQLQALGGEVLYLQADVGERPDVQRLIASIKARYGVLHGIVHAAGVTRDSFLLKKTEEELQAVLKPKVWGTVWLDEATRNEALELFVLFSSGTAVMGNVGQADYAYANGFQDNYAHWRVAQGRPGRSLSINWPLWEEGGMELAEADQLLLRELTGLMPMPTAQGLQVLEQLVSCQTVQNMPLYGQRPRIEAYLRETQTNAQENAQQSELLKSEVLIDKEWLSGRSEQTLRGLFEEVLKLSAERIDLDTPFQDYGIDSVAINQFNLKVEQALFSLPKTLLFEYPTLRELNGHLVTHYADALARCFGETAATSVSTPVSTPKVQQATAQQPTLTEPTSTEPASSKPAKAWNKLTSFRQPHGASRLMLSQATQNAEKQHTEQSAKQSTKQSTKQSARHQDIAVIGMSGRFPEAQNLDQYWANLLAGRDSVGELPGERWDWQEYYDADPQATGKMYCKWGGTLKDVDRFDPQFFGISPREAKMIDPQERLFLEVAWETFEDAGYTRERLKKSHDNQVGVFVGVTTNSYQLLGAERWKEGERVLPNALPWSIANRVSYALNLNGPSLPVDTACSASLTSLHLACDSIQKGESRLALVGGVNLYLHPAKYITMCAMKMLSPTGKCHSFGAGGDGFVPGEGIGAALLKPLAEAIADGDPIYGVIKGSSINHGGHTNGYTVPNPQAQAALIETALERSGVEARSISYVEAHGTGTSLGDPIEIAGLNKAYGAHTGDRHYCALGSVKSNIGHLESAAGISGLIKILLQMKHQTLVPTLHAEKANPDIEFENSPFVLQRECAEWKRPVVEVQGREREYPRRAAISSFGAGGSNAHAILEEYVAAPPVAAAGAQLIVLSARNRDRLQAYAQKLESYLCQRQAQGDVPTLNGIAYTLQTGREAMDERLALVVDSVEQLIEQLQDYREGREEDIAQGNINTGSQGLAVLDGRAGQAYLRVVLDDRDLKKLAQLWISGMSIDWTLLHEATKPRRISLPTYPFEGKRYWYEEGGQREAASVKSEPTLLVKASVTASTTAPPSLSEKTQSVQHPSDGMTAAEVLLERAGVYQGDEVTLQINDGIAIVTLQDRANRNMFTQRFVHGLAARLVQAQQTPGVKTIILTGYDNVFCMGGSREELMTLVERKADVDDFPFLFRGLLECKIPVIAAIQGHAVGGGLVFGLYADVVVMSEDGVYSANFMKYGFTPGMGATMILREKLGPNLATEMMFTAKSLAGAELHARGASLVFRKSGDVLSEAMSIARTLCEKPLYALEVLKQELSGRVLEGLPDIIKRETRMHAHTFTQPEVRKRVQAYFAKTQAGRAEAAKAAQGNSALTDTSITAPSTSGKIILRKQAAAMQPAKSEPDARLALPLRLSVPPATQKVTTTKAATTVVVRSDKAVTDTVESVLCQVLQAEPGSIDSQRSFNDLGVDSVTGVEIVRDLNKALGINLEAVAIYDYSSIETLARYVCEVCGVCGVCEGMAEIPGQQATADMVPELIPGNDDATSLSDGAFPRGTHEPGTSVLTLASGSNQAGDSWEAVSVNIESIVRKALQADQETIDAESSFLDLGIDSIIGVEIVRDVNKEFGLMLDAVAIYDYSTIAALSRYVYECCNKMIPERDVAVAPDKGVKIALTPRVSVSQATESGVFVVADAVKNGEAKQVVSIAAPALLPEPDTLAVATDVEAIFRRVLHAQDETLDPERNFIELGVDSVTGVEMMRGISQAFDLNLEAVVIYDYPTLAALTAYVVRLLAERGNAHAQASLQLKALVHQESSKGDFENEGLENEGLEDEGLEDEGLEDEGLIELLRQLQDGEIAVEDAEDLIGV